MRKRTQKKRRLTQKNRSVVETTKPAAHPNEKLSYEYSRNGIEAFYLND